MQDDECDGLTPKQQQAALARMRAAQRRRDAAIKKTVADMAAFVRSNPHAVIALEGEADSTPGLLKKYSLRIEVDGERFAQFMKERAAK